MRRRHQATLEAIFRRPASGSLRWAEVEAMLKELGAEISEREGSRVAVVLFGEVRVYHRPHPGPVVGKATVETIRKWLADHGVRP